MPRNLAAALAGLTLLAAHPATAQTIERKVKETRLHRVDRSWLGGSFTCSPNNRRFAHVVQKGRVDDQGRPGPAAKQKHKELFVVLDGRKHPIYADIGPDFLFSPDSRHFAYIAQKAKNDVFVVLDGVELDPYDDVFRITFGPATPGGRGARRMAYFAVKDKQCYCVVHDLPAAPAGGAPATGPAAGGPAPKVIGPFRNVGLDTLTFSPDGKHLAFAARDRDDGFVILDGEKQTAYEAVIDGTVQFTPDGRRLAYVAAEDQKWFVVLRDLAAGKDRELPAFDNVGEVTFSPAGDRLAFVARVADKQFVVLGEDRHRPHDGIVPESLAFSPDGKRFGYRVDETLTRQFMVLDPPDPSLAAGSAATAPSTRPADAPPPGRQIGRQYDSVLAGPVFSPDSKKVIYVALKDRKQFVVVNGVEEERYDGIGGGSFTFSPDGKRLAYAARNGPAWFVCYDGRVSRAYHGVFGITFTPDSRFVCFAGRKGADEVIVVGRDEGYTFMTILSLQRGGRISFTSPTDFHYLAGIKWNVYLVTEKMTVK